MAPEQAAGHGAIDLRADFYSLGIVAYEMLTGAPPFTGRTAQQLLAAHVMEPPPPLAVRRADVPAGLEALIARLLAKSPAERPADASEVLTALDALAVGRESTSKSPLQEFWTGHRQRIAVLGGALLLVALAFAVVLFQRASNKPVGERSIAVLPFVNTSGSADDEPFSDGLTDELIGALSRVPGLRVAARTSTFALKGKGLNVSTIAETLGVTTVLEGSVRRDGERLKVSAQLVDAADNHVIWSDAFDREFREVFAVQEEIARAIVAALSVQLASSGSHDRLVARGTENLEAYQLFLKARFLFNTRQREPLVRALSHFARAAALDPSYARAYAGMADVYNLQGILGYERPSDVFPKAKAAGERAVALDSTLADAYAALGHELFVYEWNWQAAETAFQRAITLDPRYPPARLYYGIYLFVTGRNTEALAQLNIARTLDPLAPTGGMIARVYLNMRQPDQAIRHLNEALELNPLFDAAHHLLGYAYLQKDMDSAAIASFKRAAELSGARDSAQLAYGYAATGQPAEARRILDRLLSTASQRYVPPFHVAVAWAGLGETDEAFRWLQTAYEQHASFMDGVAVHPGLESIRSDPRFDQLLRSMRLRPPKS
jgi:serine/threonine-protein kinase